MYVYTLYLWLLCMVCMWAVPYVGTVPDTPNIHNTLTNIGHHFAHQSDLDDRSRPQSTMCLNGFVCGVCSVFQKSVKTLNIDRHLHLMA